MARRAVKQAAPPKATAWKPSTNAALPTPQAIAGLGENQSLEALMGRYTQEEARERAFRAVKVMRRDYLPTLRAYARSLTRNPDVKVDVTQVMTPCTDGKTIWVNAPIRLGDSVRHVRGACAERDDAGSPVCPACLAYEDVMITCCHEIAHIAFGSFERISTEDVVDAINGVFIQGNVIDGTKRAAKIRKHIEDLGPNPNYMVLASKVSRWLPLMLNAVEDCRVNRQMYLARPGTLKMFRAQTIRSFRDGLENSDGTFLQYRDLPGDVQALMFILLRLDEIRPDGWLNEDLEALWDERAFQLFSAKLETLRSPAGSYRLAIEILEYMRTLGYFKLSTDEEDDKPEEEPPPAPPMPPQDDQQEADDASESDDQGDSADGDSDNEPDDTDDDEPAPTEDQPGGADEDDDEGDDATAEVDSDQGEPGGSGDGEPDQDQDDSEDGDEGDDESEDESDDEPNGSSDDGDDHEGDQAGDAPEDDDQGDDGEESDESVDDTDEPGSGDHEEGSSESEGGQDGDDQDDADGDDDDEQGDDDDDQGDQGDSDDDPSGDATDDDDESPDQGSEPDAVDGDDDDGTTEAEQMAAEAERMRDLEDALIDLAKTVLSAINGHGDEDGQPGVAVDMTKDELIAISQAAVQSGMFEEASREVMAVRFHRKSDDDELSRLSGWDEYSFFNTMTDSDGEKDDFAVNETIIGPSLGRARAVFTENARGRHERNLRGGRIDVSKLRRIYNDDDRVFKKKNDPIERDYFVLIGLDNSGSTGDGALHLIRKSGFHLAEMLNRLGVRFAVYSHNGWFLDPANRYQRTFCDDINIHKGPNDPWDAVAQDSLRTLTPGGNNYDGHSFEQYRRILEAEKATDKLLVYYTDGEMPMANYDEELEILQRELLNLKRLGIGVQGVGVGTDSPTAHGLDTVRVDELADMPKIIQAIERKLT